MDKELKEAIIKISRLATLVTEETEPNMQEKPATIKESKIESHENGENTTLTCQSDPLPFVTAIKDSPKSLKIMGWITLILSSLARVALTIYEFLMA